MPVDLHRLSDGWLELESDPGLFTLLLEDFGCQGVQVEEVYDLQASFDGPVYGFIFLFKWEQERRSRSRSSRVKNLSGGGIPNGNASVGTNSGGAGGAPKMSNLTLPSIMSSLSSSNTASSNSSNYTLSNGQASNRALENGQKNDASSNSTSQSSVNGLDGVGYVMDENIVNTIFFAQQIVPNSCATHALLSVLLNWTETPGVPLFNLGPVLRRLKEDTKWMNPENKGYAIGNSPDLARAHNSHASGHIDDDSDKPVGFGSSRSNNLNSIGLTTSGDTFHFVSYVPINGRLFELDGLKQYPIDHGPWSETEPWTEKFRRVISERLKNETQALSNPGHDIRSSLMAVVPDKRVQLLNKLQLLKTNRLIVLEAIQHMVKGARLPVPFDYHNYSRYTDVQGPDGDNMLPVSVENILDSPSPKNKSHDDEPCKDRECENVKENFRTPLTIETSISPTPSTSSSTDTSSEVGSAFNSPRSTKSSNSLSSPVGYDERITKLTVIRMTNENESETAKSKETDVPQQDLQKVDIPKTLNPNSNLDSSSSAKFDNQLTISTSNQPTSPTKMTNGVSNLKNNYPASLSPNTANAVKSASTLSPRDLIILLKKLEKDISNCETSLREELEKRKRYRIDDARRAHNYDHFITTFLAMLTEKGLIAEPISHNMGINLSNSSSNNANNHLDESEFDSDAFVENNVGRLKRKRFKRGKKFMRRVR